MKKAIAIAIFTNIVVLGFAGQGAAGMKGADQKITNVVVDSRPLAKEQKRKLEQNRLQESEELIQQQQLSYQAGDRFDYISSSQESYFPNNYYRIEGFPQSDILRLDDGSEWIFELASGGAVSRAWRQGDALVISYPAGGFWESDYKYVITNQNLGSSIYVRPVIGPIEYGHRSTWICTVDRKAGKLFLTNGFGKKTVWEVASADLDLISDWANNDHIIFAENASWLWWFSSFNRILFNVNMDHHVRARLVSSPYNYN